MTEQSVRTRALVAAGKQVAHARGEDGTWRLEVFVDAILAITEADKVKVVEAALQPVLDECDAYDDEETVGSITAEAFRRAVAKGRAAVR